jgi:short-subunit dehydrogenase
MVNAMSSSDRPTALITGASSGLGAEYARQLAARGYDLVLVARRRNKLEAVASEIRERHKVRVDVQTADLSDEVAIDTAAGMARQLPSLAMLVNNAGFGTTSTIAEADTAVQQRMLNLHVSAVYRLTRAVLPGMIERGHGAIINVSSISGFFFIPTTVNYCATKSYGIVFSKALDFEVRDQGIRVQALCPGLTYTGFHDTEELADFDRGRYPKWMWMSAERVVAESLRKLETRKVVVIPGWRNKIMVKLMKTRLVHPVAARERRKRLKSMSDKA